MEWKMEQGQGGMVVSPTGFSRLGPIYVYAWVLHRFVSKVMTHTQTTSTLCTWKSYTIAYTQSNRNQNHTNHQYYNNYDDRYDENDSTII